MATPQPGARIQVFGEDWWVADELGRGGEGSVHAVVDQSGAIRFALKWYFSDVDWRRDLLTYIVERGAPTDRFLWPLAIIEGGESFGYVMHVRPDGYASLADLLRGRVDRREDRVLVFGLELASSFLALHGMGLCYRDINFGNAFYDPVNGRALICDNDNVGIDGVSRSGVRGAPQFMAPEIVREEASPSRLTDQHSLAVMLYYLLMVGHPLEGTRTWSVIMDREGHRKFFGEDPLFAFDPADERNRPHPVDHAHVIARWHQLPAELSELFTRAFTEGLADPDARVQDSEWCSALALGEARLWRCRACQADAYAQGRGPRCPRCSTPMPSWIRTNGTYLAVSELLELRPVHLDPASREPQPLGIAELHPSDKTVLGLRNCTATPWPGKDASGRDISIEPGRRVRLRPGIRFWVRDARVDVVDPETDPG